jgi:hypothetical protein
VIAGGTDFLLFLFFSKVSFDEQDCVLGVQGDVGYMLGFVLSQLGGCLYYLLNWEGGSSLLDLFPSMVFYGDSSLLLDESIVNL